MDAVGPREDRGDVEERALRAAQAVDEQDVGPAAGRQRRDAAAVGQVHVVHPQQRLAPALEREEALEGDREVEVAPRVQPALTVRLGPGELAAAQREPGRRVRADDDVGGAAAGAAVHACGVLVAAHFPDVADVAEDDPEGRLEAGVRAEVAPGQRAEAVLHRPQAVSVGGVRGHGLVQSYPFNRIDIPRMNAVGHSILRLERSGRSGSPR